MIWLILIGGIQVLGFGFTLARLAYDEWQLRRASRKAPVEARQTKLEYATWRTATA